MGSCVFLAAIFQKTRNISKTVSQIKKVSRIKKMQLFILFPDCVIRFNVSSTNRELLQFQNIFSKTQKNSLSQKRRIWSKKCIEQKSCRIEFAFRHVLPNFLYLQPIRFYNRKRFSKKPIFEHFLQKNIHELNFNFLTRPSIHLYKHIGEEKIW